MLHFLFTLPYTQGQVQHMTPLGKFCVSYFQALVLCATNGLQVFGLCVTYILVVPLGDMNSWPVVWCALSIIFLKADGIP